MLQQTKNLAQKLRLTGLADNIERRCAEFESGNLSVHDFLGLLLSDEDISRKNKITQRLENKAHFRHRIDLEDWDSSFDRGLSKSKMKEITLLSFLHNRENLIILGKTGEGKTHLAIGIGRRACQEGSGTLFISVNFFLEEAIAAKASGKYLVWIKTISKKELIIWDDFALRQYNHEEANIFLDVLEERQRKSITIVTSQVHPDGWGKLFEDPVIAEAIVDRLKNPSQILTLKGGSYREKLGGKKTA
jgi:DNA replication protein DnaC